MAVTWKLKTKAKKQPTVIIASYQPREARAWQVTTTQCLRASRACTRVRCKAALTGNNIKIKLQYVSNLCSPGDGKATEETPHYPSSGPPYAPCSQSPGAQAAAWTGNLGTGPQGPHPAYMGGEGHPSPQVSGKSQKKNNRTISNGCCFTGACKQWSSHPAGDSPSTLAFTSLSLDEKPVWSVPSLTDP